jgi:hypothetical protein
MHDGNYYNNNKKIKPKGRPTFGFPLQRCKRRSRSSKPTSKSLEREVETASCSFSCGEKRLHKKSRNTAGARKCREKKNRTSRRLKKKLPQLQLQRGNKRWRNKNK